MKNDFMPAKPTAEDCDSKKVVDIKRGLIACWYYVGCGRKYRCVITRKAGGETYLWYDGGSSRTFEYEALRLNIRLGVGPELWANEVSQKSS